MSTDPTLFLAVRLPRAAIKQASPLLTELAHVSPLVRPVRPVGLHLTLQFLGRVPSSLEGQVREAARLAAGMHSPFTLTLVGIGTFSAASRPQAIWLGTGSGGGQLEALAASLRSQLDGAGLPFDRRLFRPHCTLARVKGELGAEPSARLRAMTTAIAPGPVCSIPVREVQLLQSVAHPGGPNLYPTRATLPLAG